MRMKTAESAVFKMEFGRDEILYHSLKENLIMRSERRQAEETACVSEWDKESIHV